MGLEESDVLSRFYVQFIGYLCASTQPTNQPESNRLVPSNSTRNNASLLRSNSGEFSLTEDFVGDDTISPYAILSHTWGADTEEATFEDLMNGTGMDKPGYGKIWFCGEQARKESLQHFWDDTCCSI